MRTAMSSPTAAHKHHARTPMFVKCLLTFIVIVVVIGILFQYKTQTIFNSIPTLPDNYVPTFTQNSEQLADLQSQSHHETREHLVNIVDKLQFHDQPETQSLSVSDHKPDANTPEQHTQCDNVQSTINLFSGLHKLDDMSRVFIWPMPQMYTLFSEYVAIANLQFKYESNCDHYILQSAIDRYHNLFFAHNNNSTKNARSQIDYSTNYLSKLIIYVNDVHDDTLDFGFNEEYELIVHHPLLTCHEILLRSKTIYGALRGLETLSQMILYDFSTEQYKILVGIIKDYPRFKHRGLMLDTARHFHPVKVVKHFLDSLSYAKFNTFHWHIVDQESFPYESKAFPNLWNGSYTEFEKYSENDILEIIEYAKLRGIRVIPEFDTPGHAGSWCKGYPQLCIDTVCMRRAHPPDLLDPSKEFTWELIDGLFEEASHRFFDSFLHLGSDEVPSECYLQDRKVKQWMQRNNIGGGNAIYKAFVERTAKLARKHHRRPIVWNEVWDNFGTQMDRNIIIQFWMGHGRQKRAQVMNDGFDLIVSYGWYLDHIDNKWQDMYTNDPLDSSVRTAHPERMLGGEACMWSEKIDFSDLDSTVWPKAATVAERLWSAKHVNNPQLAANRYRYFRCLLIRRGIGASPANAKQSRTPPRIQESCFKQ